MIFVFFIRGITMASTDVRSASDILLDEKLAQSVWQRNRRNYLILIASAIGGLIAAAGSTIGLSMLLAQAAAAGATVSMLPIIGAAMLVCLVTVPFLLLFLNADKKINDDESALRKQANARATATEPTHDVSVDISASPAILLEKAAISSANVGEPAPVEPVVDPVESVKPAELAELVVEDEDPAADFAGPKR